MLVFRTPRLLAVVLVGALALSGVLFSSAKAWAWSTGHISGYVITDSHPGPGLPIAGLTVHLLLHQPLDDVDVAQTTTTIDGIYDFDVPDAGDYLVYVDGGASWVDGSDGVSGYDPVAPGSGDIPPIELARAYSISGVVRGGGVPIPDALVKVRDSTGTTVGTNVTPISLFGTEADGKYTIKVPLTADDYTLVANGGPGWHEQAYQMIDDPCSCGVVGTPVPVNGASVAGIDFDLTGYDPTFDLYVERETAAGSGTFAAIDGLTVIIERLVGSSWTEVHREITDSSGLAYFTTPLGGTFRVRFELGSDSLRYMDSVRFPRDTYDPVGGCAATYSGVGPGTYIAVDYGFSFTDVTCSISTPSTPTTPSAAGSKAPRPARVPAPVVATPTATPTPTPTPTSTPTPSTSPSDTASPTAEPTTPPTTNASANLWWLWIIVVAVLALIVFFLIRLVRGRRP